MAYRSMFQPISQAVFETFQQSHGAYEVPYQTYDERAVVNEETGVQAGGQAPQQAQTPAQPVQQPQAQGGQQPGGQAPQQGQQPQAQGAQPQGQQAGGQIIQPQNIMNDPTWQAFNQNPSYETFKAFFDKLSQVAQKMDQQFGGQQAQTPLQPQGAQPQGQQPQAQGAQQAAPAQAQNSSMNFSKYPTYFSLYESEDDGSDDEPKSEPKKESSESKDTETKSAPKSDDNVAKGVKYDAIYNKDNGGSETDRNWDKEMHDSIFGTKEDPYTIDNEVTYSSEYTKTPIASGDKNDVDYNINATKPEPFKPEKPSFTSLSNPNALSKTVFTSEKPNIKDAPAVGSQAPAAGAGDSKTGGNGGSSESGSKETKSESKPEPKKETPKKSDDGSDEDANESFFTNYDKYLNESHVSDDIKRVVVQEFLNKVKGEFNVGEFHGWLSDNYPQIASDPHAFDELAADAENGADTGEFYEDDDPEEMDTNYDPEEEIEDDVTLEDIVNEYMDQYEGEEYDEDDAIQWLQDNYDVEDDDKVEDFLDAVSDEFIEDDINESISDEYFANEPSLNE